MKTIEFINKIKNDNQLAEKLANVNSLDEAYQLALDNKVTDSKDTFCQEMNAFRKEVSKITPEDSHELVGSLTTEILSAVSTWTNAAAAAGSAAV